VKSRILVVEDEKAIQLALRGLLSREGYEIELADDGERAVELLGDHHFDLVLTDLALGRGVTGMEVLKTAKEIRSETAVVMITAHGSEKIAVEAMKAGAEDYIPKPFDNDEIRVVVRRALERRRLEREHRLLLERIQRDFGFEILIGSGAICDWLDEEAGAQRLVVTVPMFVKEGDVIRVKTEDATYITRV